MTQRAASRLTTTLRPMMLRGFPATTPDDAGRYCRPHPGNGWQIVLACTGLAPGRRVGLKETLALSGLHHRGGYVCSRVSQRLFIFTRRTVIRDNINFCFEARAVNHPPWTPPLHSQPRLEGKAAGLATSPRKNGRYSLIETPTSG